MQPAPTDPQPGRILVIDDNSIIQRAIQFGLQKLGYEVLVAGNIADALNIVRKERPVLIMLDINFPPDSATFSGGLRDGYWALAWMHHLDEAKGIPVIVISGDDPATARPRALAAGAAAYLHKPVNQDELAATVAGLLVK